MFKKEGEMLGADSVKSKDRAPEMTPPIHYYGDTIRRLFMLAAIIMLVTLPFFVDLIVVPLSISVLSIIIVGVVAGLTNPRYLGISIINLVVAIIGFASFEYRAVLVHTRNISQSLFWTNQLLAVIFFVALYFGSKTVRGMLVMRKRKLMSNEKHHE